MESRSEMLQTQDQNVRHAEYNAALRAGHDSMSSQHIPQMRTASAPDGLRHVYAAMQTTSPTTTGYDSLTSQGTREQLSGSEPRHDGSLSPDDGSPTVTSDRNTGPSQSSVYHNGSAISSLEGVQERAEAVLRDAETVLKQQPGWAADPALAGRSNTQPGNTSDASANPRSSTQLSIGDRQAGGRSCSITPSELSPFGRETEGDAANEVSEAVSVASHDRIPVLPAMSHFESPLQHLGEDGVSSQAARLQQRSPDAARGNNRDSPSGVTNAGSPTGGELTASHPTCSISP